MGRQLYILLITHSYFNSYITSTWPLKDVHNIWFGS